MPGRVGGLLERRLGLIPDGVFADPLGGPVRELDAHVLKAEVLVDIQDQAASRPPTRR